MIYIRRIEETRWRNPRFYDSDIISDLSTTEHELSVWSYYEDDIESKNKALLAMAMTRESFKEYFYVELTEKEIQSLHFKINDKVGSTRFVKYNNLHRNIEVQSLFGLALFARIIKRKINRRELYLLDSEEEEVLFREYASPQEMDFDALSSKVFKKIYKEINGDS